MKDQIKLMNKQMKVAKIALGTALASLGVAIIFGLIVVIPVLSTWLGL